MPASGIKLLDANVWLALAFSDHQHHQRAKSWFDGQADSSCAFCRITQLALLRHLTNTKIMGKFAQSQQAAWQTYDAFINDPRVLFINEPQPIETIFRNLSSGTAPSHERWTDAYLAASAVMASAQLVTFDQGFGHYVGLDLLVLNS